MFGAGCLTYELPTYLNSVNEDASSKAVMPALFLISTFAPRCSRHETT